MLVSALVVIFTVLLLLAAPIGFALAIASAVGLLQLKIPGILVMMPQKFFEGLNSFTLMAIPFFILAGELMNKANLTQGMVDFARSIFGYVRGGLAQVNIVCSILFAGISGSSNADAAALGSLLIPAMTKDGYDAKFAAAITAASAIIGPIIPPSLVMIIYGATMNVSIASLFAGGILPGVCVGLFLMVLTYFYSKKRNYPKQEGHPNLKEITYSFKKSFAALLMPLIILGGILSGTFTPTESAGIAVIYALFIGKFIYKTISIKDIGEMLVSTTLTTGVVFLVVIGATLLGWLFSMARIPEMVATGLISMTNNKYLLLFLMNIVVLINGCFVSVVPSILVLGPIFHPLAMKLGLDPIHYGIIMTVGLTMGVVTPPVGSDLYIVSAISKVKFEVLVKEIWPMILAIFLALNVITFVPQITMFIPRLVGLN